MGFINTQTADPSFRLESYASYKDVDYAAFAAESVKILLGRDTGDDGVTTWDLLSNKRGVGLWRGTVEGSNWSPFRVKQRVNASKASIQHALTNANSIVKLDDTCDSLEVVHNANEAGTVSLRHLASKGMFPVAPRDFVAITAVENLADGRMVIASRSLDIANIAPYAGHVRALDIITGYIVEEHVDADGSAYCVVTLLAHVDLAGYIPSSIVKLLGTSESAKVLAKLKEHLEQ